MVSKLRIFAGLSVDDAAKSCPRRGPTLIGQWPTARAGSNARLGEQPPPPRGIHFPETFLRCSRTGSMEHAEILAP